MASRKAAEETASFRDLEAGVALRFVDAAMGNSSPAASIREGAGRLDSGCRSSAPTPSILWKSDRDRRRANFI
jgi:hypothetical protein